MIKVSRFERLTSIEVHPLAFADWDGLVQHIGPHRFDYRSKDSVPLICPAEYAPGTSRAKRNVMRVHWGALDIDRVSDADLDRILKRCADYGNGQGLRFLFYTTWSHAQYRASHGTNCGRLFFPFSRAVELTEWDSFWPRMRAFFYNLSDEKCSDASRIFYYPSAPEGTEEEAVFYSSEDGIVFDVDALLRTAITTAEAVQVDRSDVPRWAFNRWVKQMSTTTPHNEWLKDKLMLLIEGKALDTEGNRDNTIFKMVSAVCQRFPNGSAASIADIFKESVIATGFDYRFVLEKIERRQSEIEQEAAAAIGAHLAQTQDKIKQAFGTDRSAPYSGDEINAFAEAAGVPPATFNRFHWIVQKDASFYFFVDGCYRGPFALREVENIAPILLAPASSAGVECYVGTKNGIRPKTPNELVQQYGQVAYHIALDMTAQRSYLDLKTHTLIEAPCPARLIDVEESPNVARWLELLGGTQHEVLLDWLAAVTRLGEPCSALYLEGAKGAGKTLLANGIAAIWTTDGPTTLEDSFAHFNSMALSCPVVFADEVMPTDFQGKGRTGQLRQFIQARQRTLRRKYVPDSTLRGCVRIILAANNQDMVSTNENLTMHDIEAIVERILHVPVTEEPAVFLRALSEQGNKITPDEIASHCLWLQRTRVIDSTSRFLVTGAQTSLHRRLTTSSGLRSAICHWITSYLLEPHKMDATRSLLIRRYDGEVLATTRGLTRHWDLYETNQEAPPAGPVSKALAGVSIRKRLLKAGDGRPTWYWIVDPENVCAWAEDNGFADRAQIMELIQAPQTAAQQGAN